jgi:serine/threonine-protein kinase
MKRSRTLVAGLAGLTTLLGATSLATPSAGADGPADEQQFVEAVRTLPFYVLPSRIPTDADLLAGGYSACAVMDQYPDQPMTVLYIYYKGGNTVDGKITNDGWDFVTYAASYLCERHRDMYPQVSEDGLYGN